jgi:hypothetical protein
VSANDPIPAALVLPEETEAAWETRSQFRRELLDQLGELMLAAEHAVDGGAEDGVKVVAHRAWLDVLSAVRYKALPPVSNHAAEVVTGAAVTVWCVCPRCKIAGPILMTIEPELRVDTSSAELRLKAKAKPRTHMCGQLTLAAAAPEIEGQESLNLEELTGPHCGKAIGGEESAEFCFLPEGHEGECERASAVEIIEEPEAITPAEALGKTAEQAAADVATKRARRRRARADVGPDLSDAPDDDLLPGENLGACPWPGCGLASEHPGQHQTAVDDRDEP